MKSKLDARKNYEITKKEVGYVDIKHATQEDYDRVGFMSGLEVHQLLKTKRKLFCHCPAGIYHKHDEYDAEIIRHMRPTLSELGEYDGTALMEFKTRKEITYRINNENACTYEVDDTPPFAIDREALKTAFEITLLSKMNPVGEVHITRKQYLDGSIPAGFQRTAILGVKGEIKLKDNNINLMQLSIEEDSCREISDIGHKRVYKTDRLGMPLIETVTQPELKNPEQVKEGADYIRFLNRSTGKVLTGIGSTRADTNVSCRGGSRVEIKGVAHTKWMPKLTHIEVFRQWALLKIRDRLLKKINKIDLWKTTNIELKQIDIADFDNENLKKAIEKKFKIIAVNLPYFKGILSHFTQPNKGFASEFENRLKVIACLEKPNMTHSETFDENNINFDIIAKKINAKSDDAQIIFWGPEEDVETALETIEERAKMALIGVPEETRKSFANGSTIFERVLPGADRMYPDTDSAPIPIAGDYIDKINSNLPVDIYKRFEQLKEWEIPEDVHSFILKKNLMPMIEKALEKLDINPRFLCTFIGHKVKNVERKYKTTTEFSYKKIFEMFEELKKRKLDFAIADKILPIIYQHPQMDIDSVLITLKFKARPKEEVIAPISFLKDKFKDIKSSKKEDSEIEAKWIMGEIKNMALGNISLKELRTFI